MDEMQGSMNEMLMSLVYRARWDEGFKDAMRENPEVALAAYRYHLTDWEVDAVMTFHRQVMGLSDAQLNQRLAELADPIAVQGP